MATVNLEPLTLDVPLWDDPPGVFRVGKSRVLLDLVLRAFQRGETPEGIVRSFRTLQLADVYAVIARYLANPAPFDEYLAECDRRAEEIRRTIEASIDASENHQARTYGAGAGERLDPVTEFLVDASRMGRQVRPNCADPRSFDDARPCRGARGRGVADAARLPG